MVKNTNQMEYGESADRKSGQDKQLHQKTNEYYAKYFKHNNLQQTIRKEWKRIKEKKKVHYNLDIQKDMQNISKRKKYLTLTNGRQMNEHDAEVMAGILTKMGYEGT